MRKVITYVLAGFLLLPGTAMAGAIVLLPMAISALNDDPSGSLEEYKRNKNAYKNVGKHVDPRYHAEIDAFLNNSENRASGRSTSQENYAVVPKPKRALGPLHGRNR